MQSRGIFVIILLVTSLLSTSYILNSRALAQENEESGYVKYASQLVKDSNNSSTSKNATTIPIPQAAKGPSIPTKGYLVQQIRDNLYWVTDGGYNTMFLVTDKGVIAFPFTDISKTS